MRKTHCACLLFGMILGMPLGVSLVVLHMKFGHGPVVAVDTSPEALKETVLKDPTPDGQPLGDDGWASAEAGQATEDESHHVGLEPVGPVAVTVVHRSQATAHREASSTALEPTATEAAASQPDGCEMRLMQHLLQHARSSARTASSDGREATPAPTAEPPTQLAQAETPEELPMPAYEPAPQSATPVDQRFDSPAAYPKVTPPVAVEPLAPRPEETPAEDFDSVVRRLAVPARTPYTGAYATALREDRTLQLPAEVCDMLVGGLPESLYLVPLQQRVRLYTPKGLKHLLQALQESGYWGKTGQHEQAVLLSCIRRVDVTSEGKITIPAQLARFGGLCHKVVLVGVYDHVELWDADAWRETVTAVLPDAEGLALPADEDGETVTEVQDE